MEALTAPLPPTPTAQADEARLARIARAAAGGGGIDKAAKAARDFEAMMLTQALQSMFEGVPTDGAFGGGYAEETYRGMMLDAVARSIAEGQGLGIARHVEAQIAAYTKSKEA